MQLRASAKGKRKERKGREKGLRTAAIELCVGGNRLDAKDAFERGGEEKEKEKSIRSSLDLY